MGNGLKQHHHLRVDAEIRQDLIVWEKFLNMPEDVSLCRPFMEPNELTADEVGFYTDASGGVDGGFGGVLGPHWYHGKFGQQIMVDWDPSIQFLELYSICIATHLYMHIVANRFIRINCDNQAVVEMINNSTSSCRLCMILIRHITLVCMKNNVRLFSKYIPSKQNTCADLLSRGRILKFKQLAGQRVNLYPDDLPNELYPIPLEWFKSSISRTLTTADFTTTNGKWRTI